MITRLEDWKPSLMPHQIAAVRSSADLTVLAGDAATGKTYTIAPWLATLDSLRLHVLVSASWPIIYADALRVAIRTLQLEGIETVFGRMPPESWGVRKLPSYRSILSLSTGATVAVISARSARQAGALNIECMFIDNFEECRRVAGDHLAALRRRARRCLVTAHDGAAPLLAFKERGEIHQATRRSSSSFLAKYLIAEHVHA